MMSLPRSPFCPRVRRHPQTASSHPPNLVYTTPRNRVRKQIKIRPGYTPQEDVRRFRGTRQTQADVNALPKGHIIGWAPPPQAAPAAPASKAGLSKAQKKNEKRKEKRKEKATDSEKVKDSWEDDDEGEAEGTKAAAKEGSSIKREGVHTTDQPNWAAAPDTKKQDDGSAEGLADKLDKLEVR